MKPRVLLADDHALVVEVLVRLLQEACEVVATASDGAAALALALERQPDLLLLDVNMPVLGGIQAIRQLRSRLPRGRFVILSMYTDIGHVREAFAAGAHGYVIKDASPAELVAGVRAVARGEIYVSPQLGLDPAALEGARGIPATREGSGALTSRQLEVLRRVAAGCSGKQIADDLGISLKTVEFHKASISRQLGLRTTAALTRYAVEHGLMAGADAAE
jgi:DNA-binding NarL/FixJ family response regulator